MQTTFDTLFNDGNEFYFNTLLKYVRAGKKELYKDKVVDIEFLSSPIEIVINDHTLVGELNSQRMSQKDRAQVHEPSPQLANRYLSSNL